MNRRRFLGLFVGASTAYFFAPKAGWKSDVICQPRCSDHIHLWQIRQAMAMREKYVRDMVVRADVCFNGLQMADPYALSTSGIYLGISREGWNA